jgi:hypothetical protein
MAAVAQVLPLRAAKPAHSLSWWYVILRLLLASLAVRKSPILPVAAAITAVALSSTPSMAAALPAGKRDDHKVVSFPLLAVKGKSPAGVGSHVSHSSHVSGTGGHTSHVSHISHVSSVPAPPPPSSAPPVAPQPTTAAPPPAVPATTSQSPSPSQSSAPAPVASITTSQAPASATTPASSPTTSSPTTSGGHGCMLVIVAPFGALGSRLRRFARRGRPK